jgi:hypothetical protein
MGRYLTDLADVLRAAGLTVIEVDGWKTRARSSGGYAAGRPTHVIVHHTASPQRTDGQRDVDYIVSGSPVKPVANIYTDRQGVVWVCAAGATNTNGRGGPLVGVPADAMNLYAISNEIANNGIGEPYPAVQQQSVLTSSAAICLAYGIDVHNVRGHFEWTSRKIDPSGPSMWAASGKWDMDEFRTDVAATITQQTTPPPTTDEETDDMEAIFAPTYDPGKPGVKWWNDSTPHLAIWVTGRVTRASNAHYDLAKHKGAPVILLNSQDQYEYLVSQIGI